VNETTEVVVTTEAVVTTEVVVTTTVTTVTTAIITGTTRTIQIICPTLIRKIV
jgi:hypothetical protein